MKTLAMSAVALVLTGCATNPDRTVASLNTQDRKWNSRACVAARQAAQNFEDHKEGRIVLSLLGNMVVPFAGTAATFAMDRMRDDERRELSHQVRAACISDPLKDKRARRVASR